MKQNVKKFLGLFVALFISLPILAVGLNKSDAAQGKLVNKIHGLLQQGDYNAVKTTLSNIPVCPTEIYEGGRNVPFFKKEKEYPKECTKVKFNSDPFQMKEFKHEDPLTVPLISHDRIVKEVRLPGVAVVHPVEALKNALKREYKDRFGKDISKYDVDSYVQFLDPYKGSWLEKVATSLLAEQIWKEREGETMYEYNTRTLYFDVKWHEAQGYDLNKPKDYDKVSELRYAFKYNTDRRRLYKPYDFIDLPNLSKFLWNRVTPIPYMRKALSEYGYEDEDFLTKYRQRVYHDLFTMKNFSNAHSKEQYAAEIVILFSDTITNNWENLECSKDMPSDLLKEMQDNVAMYFPKVCKDQKEINNLLDSFYKDRHYDESRPDAKEVCKKFIENARKYGLWTEEAEKNYYDINSKEFQEAIFYHPYEIDSILPKPNSK